MKVKTTSYLCFLFVFSLFLSSCIVQAPRFTDIDKVLTLQIGMNKQQVQEKLGIPPYDLKTIDQTGETVLIYKYRVEERRTAPFLLKPNNGFSTRGKYVDLFITYSAEGLVKKIDSCSECSETKIIEKKVNIRDLLAFITVTLPVVLLYLNETSNN